MDHSLASLEFRFPYAPSIHLSLSKKKKKPSYLNKTIKLVTHKVKEQ